MTSPNTHPPFFEGNTIGFDERSFRRSLLTSDNRLACFKDAYHGIDQQLQLRFNEGENIRHLVHDRSGMIDCLLHYMWHLFNWKDDISLIAVGGYGRGELHPKSDIDILILINNDSDSDYSDNIQQLLMLFWDIGLDIGHSVRTLTECIDIAREDITVATNIMEARRLQGPESLLQSLINETAPEKMWSNEAFFLAKTQEQEQRHQKYNNIEYNLEPNLKNAPGGLRDIQTIQWIAKRFFNVVSIENLLGTDFFTEREYATLREGEEFLWRVRYGLHLTTKRADERLLFDYQKDLAHLFGYKDNDESLAIEQFMHRYYRVVLALRELNDVLLQFLDDAILKKDQNTNIVPINSRFQLCNSYIEATHDQVFTDYPSALLEIFVLLAQNRSIRGIRARTIRQMREYRHLIDEEFRRNETNNQLFIELLTSPFQLVTQLKRMVRYGILGRYLPEFGRITGQMQHDLFHIYTVDAHTLNVIRFMRKFALGYSLEEFPLACQITKKITKIELLYAAGLYHDIAKGRGGDHSTLGAVDAFEFCLQHQFSKRESRLVAWLVEHHLLMSSISQKQDLSDPQIIHDFALKIRDQIHLDYLYVLTVADMNATNPDIWNSWRASLLRELYLQTKRALRRGLENPIDRQDLIAETQEAAMEQLCTKQNIDEQSAWELWQVAGEDYFLRESAEDIAWQTEAIIRHQNPEKPLILIADENIHNEGTVTKIFIRAKSRHNIFAATTTILDQLNLNIQSARIHSTISGYTLDTFYVLDQEGNAVGNRPELTERIHDSLIEEFNLIDNYSDIIKRRIPRQLKHFSSPTRTSIHNDTTHQYTVLEVISPDRPGFLARIARIFVEHNISLTTAKIITLGERVEDIFYITDRLGNRLSDPELCKKLQEDISRQLDAKAIDTLTL